MGKFLPPNVRLGWKWMTMKFPKKYLKPNIIQTLDLKETFMFYFETKIGTPHWLISYPKILD
jgi:hypothetical protein